VSVEKLEIWNYWEEVDVDERIILKHIWNKLGGSAWNVYMAVSKLVPIAHPSSLSIAKWSLSLGFRTKPCMQFCSPPASHRTWLDHPNNIWRETMSCQAFRAYNLYVCMITQEFFCTFLTGLSEESHNWTPLRWGRPISSNRVRPHGSLMLFRLKNLPSIKCGL
jgi:hypothetical protein